MRIHSRSPHNTALNPLRSDPVVFAWSGIVADHWRSRTGSVEFGLLWHRRLCHRSLCLIAPEGGNTCHVLSSLMKLRRRPGYLRA